MSATERFNWSEDNSDKKDTDTSRTSAKPLFVPVSRAVERGVSASSGELEHPRILPAPPLFEQFVAARKEVAAKHEADAQSVIRHIPMPLPTRESAPIESQHEHEHITESTAEAHEDDDTTEDDDSVTDASAQPKPPQSAEPAPRQAAESVPHASMADVLQEVQEELTAADAEAESGELASEGAVEIPLNGQAEAQPFSLYDADPDAPTLTSPPSVVSRGSVVPPVRPVYSAGGGGSQPPPPPPPVVSSPGSAPGGANSNFGNQAPAWPNAYPGSQPLAPFESVSVPTPVSTEAVIAKQEHDQRVYEAEKRGLRRGLMLLAVYAYLQHRKRKSLEITVDEQQDQQERTDKRMTALSAEHALMSEQLAAQKQQIEQFTYAPSQQTEQAQPARYDRPVQPFTYPAEQLTPNSAPSGPFGEQFPTPQATVRQEALPVSRSADAAPQAQLKPLEQLSPEELAEQKIVLGPGERIERVPGGYSVVVDKNGHEVRGKIIYGKEHQNDQRQEHAPASYSDVRSDGGGLSGGGAYTGYTTPTNPMLDSGQTASGYQLPSGQSNSADVNHRLEEPKHPVAAAVSSPWLWAAGAVLLAAFFVAAFL